MAEPDDLIGAAQNVRDALFGTPMRVAQAVGGAVDSAKQALGITPASALPLGAGKTATGQTVRYNRDGSPPEVRNVDNSLTILKPGETQ